MKISAGWAQTEESFTETSWAGSWSVDEIGTVRRDKRGEGILDTEGRQGQEAARSQLSEYQKTGLEEWVWPGNGYRSSGCSEWLLQLPQKPGGYKCNWDPWASLWRSGAQSQPDIWLSRKGLLSALIKDWSPRGCLDQGALTPSIGPWPVRNQAAQQEVSGG